MKDAERLLDTPLDVVEVLDYGEGATHDVVLVARRDDPATRYVAKRSRGDPGPLITERCALTAYAQHEASRALVPDIVAASDDGALLIVEALAITDADRLGVILEGEDPIRARDAVLAHMRALAVLNGVPAADSFSARIDAVGDVGRSRHAVHYLLHHAEQLPARLSELGGEPGNLDDDESLTVSALVHDREPFGALSHGDGTAANTFVTREGRAYVVDFETADVRHAGLDGAFARIRYLNSVWALELPAVLRDESARAYRETLASFLPSANDDARWAREETVCAAAWLAILLRQPERYLDGDERWGRSSIRWRVFTGLVRFVDIARANDRMPATAEACERGITALRNRWPEEHRTARTYRAFAQA